MTRSCSAALLVLFAAASARAQQKPGLVTPPPGDDATAEVPLSLTASDGSGLRITSFVARAVVEDPLAFTELHLTFKNPRPRQIEGQFEITLPPGATISRFAMRQSWGWQEGEVVELEQARAAYEDFLHRRQDPALLEKQAGNQFHARVFPIPASGEKEIIIAYSQELTRNDDPYRIHLRGLPQLDELDIRALIGKRGAIAAARSSLGGTAYTSQVVEVRKQRFVPFGDFEVALDGDASRLGLRHDNLVVARVLPVAEAAADAVDGLTVLFDTSASRAPGYGVAVARLGRLVDRLRKSGGVLPLRVVAFDQEVEEIFNGPANGFGAAQLDRLIARRALGASDLSGALGWLKKKGQLNARLVVITDGIATAGEIEGPALRKAVAALGSIGVKRLDVVVTGGIRDEAMLKQLTCAGLPRDGVVVDGELTAERVASKLERATFSGVQVRVPGAAWVWPAVLDGVQPGDQVLIYADLPRDQPFSVELAGAHSAHQAVTLAETTRPLLERSWVNARIHKLMQQRDTLAGNDNDLRDALKKEIIALSEKHRVLSDFTGLLVLETEADYQRFHIDRRALSDILVVGAGGIEVANRKDAPLPVATRPMDERDSDGVADRAKVARDPGPPRAEKKASSGRRAHGGDGFVEGGVVGGVAGGTVNGVMGGSAGGVASGSSTVLAPPMAPPPMPMPMRSAPRPEPSSPGGVFAAGGEGRGGGGQGYGAGVMGAVSAPPQQQADRFPYEGKLLEVMTLLKSQQRDQALRLALKWHSDEPGDVLSLIALGEVWEAMGKQQLAARAYGSIIDLFPGRADLRRFAGERLEHLGADGLTLAIDTFRQARVQRPDHPASHRLLAFALLRAGRPEAAFDVIAEGARRDYPDGRFRGVARILHEDVGLIGAAWATKKPAERQRIGERVRRAGAELPRGRSLRFVLNWETDANDVDFHIFDGKGGHAWYSSPHLTSGGDLYADVTTGYGPECFTIFGAAAAYPYKLQAHYYSRGPMGYGMGKLEIIEDDGQGNLRFDERPFVIMTDGAFVDLGTVQGALK